MSRRAEIEISAALDVRAAIWADHSNGHDEGLRDLGRQIVASRPRPIEAGVRVKDVPPSAPPAPTSTTVPGPTVPPPSEPGTTTPVATTIPPARPADPIVATPSFTG